MTKDSLEDEITREELLKKVKELKKEVDEVKQGENEAFEETGNGLDQKLEDLVDSSEDQSVSRRRFLKGVLGGAAGVSAAAMIPSASALDFESTSGFSFSNQTSNNFELGNSGNLDLKGGDINNAGAASVDKISVGEDGPAQSFSEIAVSSNMGDIFVKLENGNPKAYGSEGSIISQNSDAATVIQAAIDSLESNGGGTIQIGPGEFPLNQGLSIPSNTTIVGSGMGQTVLKAEAEAKITGSSSPAERIVIKDFTFDGQNQGGQTRIFISGANRCEAHRVGIINCGGRGSTTSSGGLAWRTGNGDGYNKIIDCYAENCAYVSLSTQKQGKHNEIRGCVVKDPNTSGSWGPHPISIESNTSSIMSNNIVVGGGNPALNFNGVDSSICVNNTVRNAVKGINNANGGVNGNIISNNAIKNVNQGIRIQVTSTGQNSVREDIIANNTVTDFSRDAVRIKNGSHSVVRNNVLVSEDGGERSGVFHDGAGYAPDVCGNYIVMSNGQGIKIGSYDGDPAREMHSIMGNTLISTSPSDTGRPMELRTGKCSIIGNQIAWGENTPYIGGENNIALGNISDVPIAANGQNNVIALNLTNPRLKNTGTPGKISNSSRNINLRNADGEINTATLYSGSSPAARITGVSGSEEAQPVLEFIRPDSSTTPDTDYAYTHYFEYKASSGQWDLVIEWRNDPGSNIDVEYSIGTKA